MASFVREESGIAVSGELTPGDTDELVRQACELMDAEASQLLLDLRKADSDGSSFIGAVAQLGAEARARSKLLVVRADGRLADMLVWAGLHRVVTLHVSGSPPQPQPPVQ